MYKCVDSTNTTPQTTQHNSTYVMAIVTSHESTYSTRPPTKYNRHDTTYASTIMTGVDYNSTDTVPTQLTLAYTVRAFFRIIITNYWNLQWKKNYSFMPSRGFSHCTYICSTVVFIYPGSKYDMINELNVHKWVNVIAESNIYHFEICTIMKLLLTFPHVFPCQSN